MTQFKCNGCARKHKFRLVDYPNMPEGFGLYECINCKSLGIKNLAEQDDRPNDSVVNRCKSCGAWQFESKPCHTCLLIGEYDANI